MTDVLWQGEIPGGKWARLSEAGGYYEWQVLVGDEWATAYPGEKMSAAVTMARELRSATVEQDRQRRAPGAQPAPAAQAVVPGRTLEALRRYIKYGTPPGGFLRAVLENDLLAAWRASDEENRTAMLELVRILHREAPATCWRSPEAVSRWIGRGGLTGSVQPGEGAVT